MINLTSLLVITCLYMLAFGSSESKHISFKKVKYRYERPNDWANDSTVSQSKKEYCEYVYTKEIEDYKRSK